MRLCSLWNDPRLMAFQLKRANQRSTRFSQLAWGGVQSS